MAVTAYWYGVPIKNQYDGTAVIDWNTNTEKTSLWTAYTANQDTHDFYDDIGGAGTESSGTGYSTGGVTLTTCTVTYDTGTNEIRLNADNAVWSSSSFSAAYAVTYEDTGGASSTDPVISYVDFGGTETVSSGTFTIAWSSGIVAKITVS